MDRILNLSFCLLFSFVRAVALRYWPKKYTAHMLLALVAHQRNTYVPYFDFCQEEDIRRRTSAAGINADAASAGLGVGNALGGAAGGGDEATQELAAAVESLPKLLEQKKGLEMHTNILKVHTANLCLLQGYGIVSIVLDGVNLRAESRV